MPISVRDADRSNTAYAGLRDGTCSGCHVSIQVHLRRAWPGRADHRASDSRVPTARHGSDSSLRRLRGLASPLGSLPPAHTLRHRAPRLLCSSRSFQQLRRRAEAAAAHQPLEHSSLATVRRPASSMGARFVVRRPVPLASAAGTPAQPFSNPESNRAPIAPFAAELQPLRRRSPAPQRDLGRPVQLGPLARHTTRPEARPSATPCLADHFFGQARTATSIRTIIVQLAHDARACGADPADPARESQLTNTHGRPSCSSAAAPTPRRFRHTHAGADQSRSGALPLARLHRGPSPRWRRRIDWRQRCSLNFDFDATGSRCTRP